MKRMIALLLFAMALPLHTSLGQDDSPPVRGGGFGQGGRGRPGRGGGGGFGQVMNPPQSAPAIDPTTGLPVPQPELPKFDLDFPGGTPKELVAAIQKASGRPLNAVIPDDEHAATRLPALKMKGVTVPQLFAALQWASAKTVPIVTGISYVAGGRRIPSYTYQNEAYGFKTEGVPKEDSIWYFHYDAAVPPPLLEEEKQSLVCRFYQLAPYLEMGYTVDDITTAMKTGWKMLGETSTPTMNFHKETKLLIAVGDPEKLQLIDDALSQLGGPQPRTNPSMPRGGRGGSRGAQSSTPAPAPHAANAEADKP